MSLVSAIDGRLCRAPIIGAPCPGGVAVADELRRARVLGRPLLVPAPKLRIAPARGIEMICATGPLALLREFKAVAGLDDDYCDRAVAKLARRFFDPGPFLPNGLEQAAVISERVHRKAVLLQPPAQPIRRRSEFGGRLFKRSRRPVDSRRLK